MKVGRRTIVPHAVGSGSTPTTTMRVALERQVPGVPGDLGWERVGGEVTLKAARLDRQKMVMDFTELGRKMKTWLDENLDHKVILAKADPLVPVLKAQGQLCYLTAENPTAEILAKLVYDTARALRLPVDEAAFWETPTSMASYRE